MSDSDETKGEQRVQIVDRRRFDSGGNERATGDDAPPAATVESVTSPSAATGQAAEKSAAEFTMQADEEGAEEVSFSSFIMSLATQTMVQMGEMQPPPGLEIPIDVESARQTIDILAMLQRKTRGNLSAEEARFMEEVLHTLRMSYVRRKKR
jgi:hypothetical protein